MTREAAAMRFYRGLLWLYPAEFREHFGDRGAAAHAPARKGTLRSQTHGDPSNFVAVSALLASTALLAGYLPARRATRIDPMQALRDQ